MVKNQLRLSAMKPYYAPAASNSFRNKISRISWPAIFAGALTAVVVVFMLNLLGLGIGLSTINPMTESEPFKGLGTGTLIWLGLSNLAALFAGGLIAGRMSGYPSKADGGLHGFLSWALFTIFSLFLIASTIGSIVSGISGAVSGIFGGNGSKDITVMVDKAQKEGLKATDLSLENIKKEVFQLINKADGSNIISDSSSRMAKNAINKTGSNAKQAVKNINVEDLEQFFNTPEFDIDDKGNLQVSADGNGSFLREDELRDYLIKNTQLSNEEINGLVEKWSGKIETAADKAEKYYAEAKQKVVEYSDKAADAAATASISAFVLFLLGALAAYFGGMTGSPKLTVDEEHLDDQNDRTRTVQD